MDIMEEQTQPKQPRIKMREYRKRMQASGLRLVQLWIPDTRTEYFIDEAKRQSLNTSHAIHNENDILDFIEQAADW